MTHTPPIPPRPSTPPRDWLDDILDSNATPDVVHPAPQPDPDPEPADADPAPRKRRGPRLPYRRGRQNSPTADKGRPTDQHPATLPPRSSLFDAFDAVPTRVRRLIANSAAAGFGWSLGAVDFATDVVDWVHDEGPADPQSIFWFLVGIACLALYRRSRAWSWPVAWLASVPAATAVAGVLLYAPAA